MTTLAGKGKRLRCSQKCSFCYEPRLRESFAWAREEPRCWGQGFTGRITAACASLSAHFLIPSNGVLCFVMDLVCNGGFPLWLLQIIDQSGSVKHHFHLQHSLRPPFGLGRPYFLRLYGFRNFWDSALRTVISGLRSYFFLFNSDRNSSSVRNMLLRASFDFASASSFLFF